MHCIKKFRPYNILPCKRCNQQASNILMLQNVLGARRPLNFVSNQLNLHNISPKTADVNSNYSQLIMSCLLQCRCRYPNFWNNATACQINHLPIIQLQGVKAWPHARVMIFVSYPLTMTSHILVG